MNDTTQAPAANSTNDIGQQGHPRRVNRAGKPHPRWTAGVLLIVLGVVALGLSTGGFTLTNWWALFILIPAVGAFETAWSLSRSAGGKPGSAARGSLIAGILITCVAGIFLFNLSWAFYGPLLLILAGLGYLVNFVLMN